MPRRSLFGRSKHNASVVAPMLAATDLGNGEAEIVMYGDVCENEPRDWYTGEPTGELVISSQRFLQELDTVKNASHINIRLNSGGGDVFAGVAIYNALKDLSAKITIHVEGLAASAASLIACAGDEVIVYPSSMMMVHEGYVAIFGWYTPGEIELIQNQCNAVTQSMVNIYMAQSGRDEDDIRELVSSETWFVGQDIVDAGFATICDTPNNDDDDTDDGEVDEVVYDATAQTLTIGGIRHDASMYRNIPNATHVASTRLHASASLPDAVAIVQEPQAAAIQEGGTLMNLEELTASHPELVAQIQQQAQADERERMQAIDEIAASIPADLVETAKYREPMTAAELALASVRASNNQGQRFMAAMEEDEEESNTEDVDAEPNDGNESTENEDDKEAQANIAKAAAIINKSRGVN